MMGADAAAGSDRSHPGDGPAAGAALIGLDWGGSRVRAALLDARGGVLARRESDAGVFAVRDGDFAAAAAPLVGDWLAQRPSLALLAAGMIGSRQGAVEVPYLACPATLGDVAAALGRVELRLPSCRVALHIVPGLKVGGADAHADVLRGEETQWFGAGLAHEAVSVLPGTHSKWIAADADGRLDAFVTFMTGELFDLLTHHGSLARLMPAPHGRAADGPGEAFDAGVGEARDGDLADRLFRVRVAGLTGRFAPPALADYLSGLLIGAEIAAGRRRFASRLGTRPVAVLGEASLTRRYVRAFAAVGIGANAVGGDAVFTGLAAIAAAAGLVRPEPSVALEGEP